MSGVINVILDGQQVSATSDQKVHHLLGDVTKAGPEAVVVCRINGELKDLWSDFKEGDVIESVAINSPDGLNVLRHSTAHVLAQAVQQLFPQTKLGIGPPITDGFYYDFDPSQPFTPSDLEELEKAMRKIIKDGQRFK
ncbi:MAG: threonine--tRNA ligase, partial [Candidatus Nanopelagicaceae bacterium]